MFTDFKENHFQENRMLWLTSLATNSMAEAKNSFTFIGWRNSVMNVLNFLWSQVTLSYKPLSYKRQELYFHRLEKLSTEHS